MTPKTTPEPHASRLALRVTEAAQAIGISRSKCYQLIASNDLPSARLGKSGRVPVAELKRWFAERVGND